MKNKNYFEAAIVHAIVEYFVQLEAGPDDPSSVKPKDMAVVTPFTDQ